MKIVQVWRFKDLAFFEQNNRDYNVTLITADRFNESNRGESKRAMRIPQGSNLVVDLTLPVSGNYLFNHYFIPRLMWRYFNRHREGGRVFPIGEGINETAGVNFSGRNLNEIYGLDYFNPFDTHKLTLSKFIQLDELIHNGNARPIGELLRQNRPLIYGGYAIDNDILQLYKSIFSSSEEENEERPVQRGFNGFLTDIESLKKIGLSEKVGLTIIERLEKLNGRSL